MNGNDTWTQAHDLALLYIAMAYGTDYKLVDEEMESIIAALQRWQKDIGADEAKEVVMEALAVYLEKDAEDEVARSMLQLKETLEPQELEQAIEDLVRIAESDGILLRSEYSLISVFSDIWEVKTTGDRLMAQSSVHMEEKAGWTLLHDIALLFMVVTHSANNQLNDADIAAMISRLSGWQPELGEQGIRAILREALQFYSKGVDEGQLSRSVASLKDHLPIVKRLAVLDDLVYIAYIDGTLNTHEREMITMLAKVWQVEVRLES